jgi:hypothetical protein
MHRPPFYFSLVYSHRAIFVIIFRNHLNGILGIFFFYNGDYQLWVLVYPRWLEVIQKNFYRGDHCRFTDGVVVSP